MDKKKKKMLLIGGVVGGAALLWWLSKGSATTTTAPAPVPLKPAVPLQPAAPTAQQQIVNAGLNQATNLVNNLLTPGSPGSNPPQPCSYWQNTDMFGQNIAPIPYQPPASTATQTTSMSDDGSDNYGNDAMSGIRTRRVKHYA